MATVTQSARPGVAPDDAVRRPAPRPARRRGGRAWGGRLFTGLLAVALALFILGPLVWLGVHAFATSWTYPHLLPDGWTMQWWSAVFDDPNLSGSVVLSLEFAVVTMAVSAVLCLPAAYAFARFDFPGRRVFLIGLFATNAFPKMGLFVALASLFYTLNLMSTFVGVVIIHLLGTVVFMTWIPAAAFAAVPRSLEEAARDAGAGRFTVLRTVTLPLALPGILVALIMSFLASFDEAQGTYLVGNPDFVTMPTQMYSLVLNYPPQVAAVFSILLAVPSAVLLLLVRKHVMGGQLAEGFQIR
ncbi:ABC transporter permease [Lapillicoccus jejuensis]|uniref:Putative spermidine/putrescine transport system permease protein n=1 Tax=Lapillicoccus jejuensis TaxID=402171 RepID=A0A542E1J8_9MICO|nr:ABC transporter permease [Lapillicoccus jejuensis]TQJ09213.1 putative spermidine/putrescine transport system permease protein [Lapillicoccus jejuensis]